MTAGHVGLPPLSGGVDILLLPLAPPPPSHRHHMPRYRYQQSPRLPPPKSTAITHRIPVRQFAHTHYRDGNRSPERSSCPDRFSYHYYHRHRLLGATTHMTRMSEQRTAADSGGDWWTVGGGRMDGVSHLTSILEWLRCTQKFPFQVGPPARADGEACQLSIVYRPLLTLVEKGGGRSSPSGWLRRVL